MTIRFRMALCAAVVGVLAGSAFAENAKAPAGKPAAKHAAKATLEMMTPDQMKWEPNPGDPNVKMATAWGDSSKGAHGAFHKFPAGWTSPLHSHSADLKIAVISGTWIQKTEDGKETRLPPGSYELEPHNVKHISGCDAGSECVIFVVANGKFDLIPADGAGKAAAPKAEPKKK
jgi:anti-sigma factor ChrR (cupin superfamily)